MWWIRLPLPLVILQPVAASIDRPATGPPCSSHRYSGLSIRIPSARRVAVPSALRALANSSILCLGPVHVNRTCVVRRWGCSATVHLSPSLSAHPSSDCSNEERTSLPALATIVRVSRASAANSPAASLPASTAVGG